MTKSEFFTALSFWHRLSLTILSQSTETTAGTEQEERTPPFGGLLPDCLPSGQGELVNTCFLSHWTSDSKNAKRSQKVKVKSESEVTQSCPTLCDPVDCSLPGFSVRGLFQARVPEWAAISFPEEISEDEVKTSTELSGGLQGLPHINWDHSTPWVTPLESPLETGCLLPIYIPFSFLWTSRQDWANISAWFQNNSALQALLGLGESSVPIPQCEAKGEQPWA